MIKARTSYSIEEIEDQSNKERLEKTDSEFKPVFFHVSKVPVIVILSNVFLLHKKSR